MRSLRDLFFQLRHNYYVKFVVVFFSIITASLLMLLIVFARHQYNINNKELHDFDSNSFSRFTQVLEKKILADVYEVMSKGVTDIQPYHILSDANVENPFLSSNNPFNTTLAYMRRLNQLQQYYPYIASIDLYSYKHDTFITSYGSAYYGASARKDDLASMVPFHIIDAVAQSDSDQLWLSPSFNRVFPRYAEMTSFVQKMPLFNPSGNIDLAIIINIRPSVLLADYFQGQMPEDAFFAIVDDQGSVILKTSSDARFTDILADVGFMTEVIRGGSQASVQSASRETQEVLWQASAFNNWKYLYVSTRPGALRQLYDSLRYVITWFFIIFASCLLITLVVSKRIYKPIALLAKYARSITKEAEEDADDDIGELSNAFTRLYGQLSNYRETISSNAPLLLNNIAMNLLDGRIHSVEELNAWLTILNLRFEHESFFLLVFKIDAEAFDSLDNRERDFIQLYVKEHVDRYLGSSGEGTVRCISCALPNGVVPFILNCRQTHYEEEKRAASVILSNMSEDIATHVSVAISDQITDLTAFNATFRQTLDYFKYVFVYGNKTVYDSDMVRKLDNGRIDVYDNAFKKSLSALLHLNKLAEAKEEIARFFLQAKEKDYSFLYLQSLTSEIASMIIHEYQRNDIALPNLQNGDMLQPYARLTNIDRCIEWFDDLIDIYDKAMQEKLNTLDSEHMKRILAHIDEHIGTVTLGSVSEAFKLSTAHFSRMFKKNMGINLSDHVMNKRFERACILLSESDMKVSDIADTLGYLNANYFNKIFKTKYQMTPTQYRKLHRK